MRLLDRYLLRELLIPLVYCLSGFLVFWIAFDLFSEIGEFQRNGLSAVEVVEYYLLKLPEMLAVVLPIALLLALLYALTNHARHHELTAMRAAGVSLGRLAVPYLAVGLLFSFALLAINELWMPDSAVAADALMNRTSGSATNGAAGQWETKLVFTNAKEKRTWLVAAYNVVSHEMINPHVTWTLPDGTRREISAERAHREDEAWVFSNVRELTFPPTKGAVPIPSETNALVMTDFAETPEAIRSEIKVSRLEGIKAAKRAALSIGEIRSYQRLHPDLEAHQPAWQDYFDPRRVRARSEAARKWALLQTQWHGRLAAPWTCLMVVLIAIPFGAASGRRNVFVGVAASLFICFAYFILLRLGLALGTGLYLPPALGAWAPNSLFGLVGLYLAWRAR